MLGLKKENVIYLFFIRFTLLLVFAVLFFGNLKYVYGQDFTIDRIWTSDLDGNEKGFFLPGDSVRYHIDITSVDEKIILIRGNVSGTKNSNKLGVEREWKTILKIQMIWETSGQNSISWDKIIPQKAKIGTEAVVNIDVITKGNVKGGSITFFVGDVTDRVPFGLQQQAMEKVESLVSDIKKVVPNLDE